MQVPGARTVLQLLECGKLGVHSEEGPCARLFHCISNTSVAETHLVSQAGLEALLLQAVTGLSPGAAAAAVTSCWHPCSPTRTMLAVSATPAAEEHFKGTMASVSHSGSFFDRITFVEYPQSSIAEAAAGSI